MVLRYGARAKHTARATHDECGAIALLTALFSSVLLLTSGLVVDLGMAWSDRAEAQNAADASALAAGNKLYADGTGNADITGATAAAKAYALSNFGTSDSAWSSCTDPGHLTYAAPGTPCVSYDSATAPSHVRVRIPGQDVSSVFAGLVGIEKFRIAAGATAGLDPGAVITCALCVIGEGEHGLGNGDAIITNSSVHLNGSVTTGPNGGITAVGTGEQITVEGDATGNFTPDATTGSPRMGDPLAGLVLPSDFSQMQRHSDPCTQGPGVYGAVVLSDGPCALHPGLYVITGSWSMKNNTLLTGTGVSIYATCGSQAAPQACTPGQTGGGEFDGTNGSLDISGSAPQLPGVVIAYDRNNANDITVIGNGDERFGGTIYAPSARLYANGNSGHDISQGTIVVGDIYLNGQNTSLQLSNPVETTWKLPPSGLHLTQ